MAVWLPLITDFNSDMVFVPDMDGNLYLYEDGRFKRTPFQMDASGWVRLRGLSTPLFRLQKLGLEETMTVLQNYGISPSAVASVATTGTFSHPTPYEEVR